MRSAVVDALRRLPGVREALVLAWRDGRLAPPTGEITVHVAPSVPMSLRMDEHAQRKMALGVYEPGETRIVRRLLRPGDTFVDVGAHIGWFSVLAARRVAPGGQVIALEPFPSSVALLTRNLDGFGRVATIHRVAAGEVTGSMSVGQQPGSESTSVTAAPAAGASLIDVPVARIDDLVPDQTRVRLMKLDVEGYELHALQGARSTLARTDHVLMELNDWALGANGTSAEAVLELVATCGLTSIRRIRSRVLRPARRRSGGAGAFNVLATRDPLG